MIVEMPTRHHGQGSASLVVGGDLAPTRSLRMPDGDPSAPHPSVIGLPRYLSARIIAAGNAARASTALRSQPSSSTMMTEVTAIRA